MSPCLNCQFRIGFQQKGVHLEAARFDDGCCKSRGGHTGNHELNEFDLTRSYDVNTLLHIGKYDPEQVVNDVYFDENKEWTMVKRFKIETSKVGEKYRILSDHKNSKPLFASVKLNPRIEYSVKVKGKKLDGEVSLGEFMDVKGWEALGNGLSDKKLLGVQELEEKVGSLSAEAGSAVGSLQSEPAKEDNTKLYPGDTIDFDVKGHRGRCFDSLSLCLF